MCQVVVPTGTSMFHQSDIVTWEASKWHRSKTNETISAIFGFIGLAKNIHAFAIFTWDLCPDLHNALDLLSRLTGYVKMFGTIVHNVLSDVHKVHKAPLCPSSIITTFTIFILMFRIPLRQMGTSLVLPTINKKNNIEGIKRLVGTTGNSGWDHYFSYCVSGCMQCLIVNVHCLSSI